MATSRHHPLSRITQHALALLGQQIKLGRKTRRMTAQDLAERAGVSRGFVQRLERGDPGCQIGAAFEVAVIVGVRLFETDEAGLRDKIKDTDQRLKLLPKHTHPPRKVDDAF